MKYPAKTSLVLFLLLLFFLSGATFAAAADKTIRVGAVSGAVNAEVSVPITLESPSGVGGIAFTLIYDPLVFEYKGVQQGGKVLTDPQPDGAYQQSEYQSNLFYKVNDLKDGSSAAIGRLVVAAASAQALGSSNLVVFNFRFLIKGGNGSYPIVIARTIIDNPQAGYNGPTLIPALVGMPAATADAQGFFPTPVYASVLENGSITVTGTTYSLGGKVTYGTEGGTNATGCSVVLTKDSVYNGQTTVGSNGLYSFTGKIAGDYKISVASLNPGYSNYESAPITLSANKTDANAVLAEKQQARLTGQVTSGYISGLMVKILDGSGAVVGIYQVNANGSWSTELLPTGTYHHKLVYGSLEGTLDGDTFDKTQLKTIGGTITGLPGTGGALTASSAKGKLTKTQDVTDGSYIIRNLVPADDYIVSVAATGLPLTYYNGKTDVGEATKVNISSGNANGINFFDLATSGTGTISGEILEGGAPVIGKMVYAFNTSTYAMVTSLTGAGGAYAIPVKPGTYEVFFVKASGKIFYFFDESGLATQNEANAKPVTVATAGSTVTEVNINVAECDSTISGKVTLNSSTGTPVANALVTAFTNNSRAVTLTGQDGAYVLQGLCSGSYTVEMKPLVDNYPVMTRVSISAGSQNVDFTIKTGFELKGKVTELNNPEKPIAGALVYLKDQETGAIVGGRVYFTDTIGNYSIKGLDSGIYIITVSHADYRSSSEVVVISDEDVKELNITLEKGAHFKGTVTNNTAASLSGATVIAITSGADPSYATTSGAGNYNIFGLDEAKPYQVMAQKRGYEREAVPDKYPSTGGTSVNFTLTPPAVTYTVSGTVTIGGNVLPDATVLLSSTAKNFFASATTNGSGEYTIPGVLPASDYRIVVIPPVGMQPFVDTGRVVSSNIDNWHVNFDAGAEISGSVGGVAPSVMTYVFLYKGDAYVTYAMTNSEGHYRFQGLTAGSDYKLFFVASGYVSQWYNGKVSKETADNVTAGAPLSTVNLIAE